MTFEIPELDAIVSRIDEMEKTLLNVLLQKGGRTTVDVSDVCVMEGVSRSQVRPGGSERYLLPRFGESAYPTGTTRWPIEEYISWRKRDPFEREQEYREKLMREARKMKATRDDAISSAIARCDM